MTTPGRRLRELIDNTETPLLLPGAANALTARLIEECGFSACYVSGAGVANTFLGVPDIGLLTASELTDHVAAIANAVAIPLVVDADTGFGNALNVQRTVRTLESAGAAAIQLEDQVTPKRCGHFVGKEVIPKGEMVGKVRAALDARLDEATVIIARTDAAAVLGMDEAISRATAYQDAGADVLFVEAPRTVDDLRAIPYRVPGKHMVNMVEDGLTPLMSREELKSFGFSIVLYANSALRGSVRGMRTVLQSLAEQGDTSAVLDQMIRWEDRQAIVRKPEFDRLRRDYGATEE